MKIKAFAAAAGIVEEDSVALCQNEVVRKHQTASAGSWEEEPAGDAKTEYCPTERAVGRRLIVPARALPVSVSERLWRPAQGLNRRFSSG